MLIWVGGSDVNMKKKSMTSNTDTSGLSLVKAKSENLGVFRSYFTSERKIVVKGRFPRRFIFDRRQQKFIFERKLLGVKLSSREIEFSDIKNSNVCFRNKGDAYWLGITINCNSESGIAGYIEIRLTYGFFFVSRFIYNRLNKMTGKQHKLGKRVIELVGVIRQMLKAKVAGEIDVPKKIDIDYYRVVRETIHGLDNLIVTVIHQSVIIITAALTLGVGLSGVIGDPWNRVFLGIITIIAFYVTWGSQRRVKLYSDILVEQIEVAEKMEESLISNDSIRITRQVERNVKHAGMDGEAIFLMGIKTFYAIEFALAVYLVLSPIFGWKINS